MWIASPSFAMTSRFPATTCVTKPFQSANFPLMKKEFQEVAVNLAKQAGQFQLSKLHDQHNIEYKGAIDIVTEVDKACEALIIGELQKNFPDHSILAEEGGGQESPSAYKWIIDPLDGTVNYAHGFPVFCVSIALEKDGEIILGVIYDPNRDELFKAVKGEGATLNGKSISISACQNLTQALLATGFAYNVQESGVEDNLDHFSNFIKKSRAVRRLGSAAIDMAWVACGRLEGFWELYLHPREIAAGALIITEAGGKVTSFDSGDFNLYGDEILVSNEKIHQQMSDVLCNNV